MDKAWQKNLVAFLGLIAAIMGVWAFFPGRAERAPASVDIDLEERFRSERKVVLEITAARSRAIDEKLDAIRSSLQDLRTESREFYKKLDDRLYELQRHGAASRGVFLNDGG